MVMKEKRLCLNKDKSVCLLWGTTKQKNSIKKELKKDPLKCEEVEMTMTDCDKWLGDYLHTDGLAASALETIIQREGKVKGAALEIATIVDDWRSHLVGGFVSGLLLWESCCVYSLLHNSGSWVDLSGQAEKRLESLQVWFLRLLLRQGPWVASSSLLWETETLSMSLRIWREKASLALHIVRLSEDSLANQIWKEQMLYEWPGLAAEVKEITRKLGIEDVNTTELSKTEFRKTVTAACHQMNEVRLCEEMKGQTKCEKILAEGYGRKEYFKKTLPGQVCQYFATRTSMLAIAGNFSPDRRFERTDWLCVCGQREEQEHLLRHCPMYDDIRAKYEELESDESLVPFFQEVLEKRDKQMEKEKKERGQEKKDKQND